MIKTYLSDIKKEFSEYSVKKLSKDFMAGINVCAVAIPLSIAFGVGSGVNAHAGLISAIIGGIIIALFSGASFQISGPTGALMAILSSLIIKYGFEGMFAASLMAGIMLVLAGIFKVGRIISIIPSPVVTGFSSGIAIIIALGQVDSLFGVSSQGETALQRISSYVEIGFSPRITTLVIGICCIVLMCVWPKTWQKRCPSSLICIILATAVCIIFSLEVDTVGKIPQSLLPDIRLKSIPFDQLHNLIIPALSIASICMLCSLFCGTSCSKIKYSGEKLRSDRELIAQGIGNIIIPFFGGIPAAAATARTSVNIKSGGQTRLVAVIHSLLLIVCMFILAPYISKIPLSALAGVLIVTAFRMNDWQSIKYISKPGLRSAMMQYLVTMCSTVLFNLTIAILIGVVFSALNFILSISKIDISIAKVDPSRLRRDTIPENAKLDINVVYLTGPIFFATIDRLETTLKMIADTKNIVFSMRGVPLIDTSALQAFELLCKQMHSNGVEILFSSLQPSVKDSLAIVNILENQDSFNNAEDAICYIFNKQKKETQVN